MHWGNLKRWVGIGALVGMAGLLPACSTTTKDVDRWANTQQGPDKLVAVLIHDKYPISLRVHAAATLVSMKPREGRRIGIDRLLEAYPELSKSERAKINKKLVPEMTQALLAPPPKPGAKGETVDTSVAYKDAGFGLLTNEPEPLIEDEQLRQAMKAALIQWAMADFARRMDAPGQKVGMMQMLRKLGADSVKSLPRLIQPEAPKIPRIAQIIAEIGDDKTKAAAAKQLVKIAQEVASKAWLDKKAPALRKANEQAGLKVEGRRFATQLARFQEEELMRTFGSMKRIGGPEITAFLVNLAGQEDKTLKTRLGALAALEGKLGGDAGSPALDGLFKLAENGKTPPEVRALVMRRIGEFPRKAVVARLYGMFGSQDWKIRQAAAELILLMSDSAQVPEFMKHLAKVDDMCVAEPLRYGRLLGSLKGPKPASQWLDSYTSSKNKASVRLAALGYYYAYGVKEQLSKVAKLERDRQKVPGCPKESEDCTWKCGGEEVERVGQFVKQCVVPHMQTRTAAPKAKAPQTATPAPKVKKALDTPAKASQETGKNK